MNGSTSIFDFIDGALDPMAEQELFDELARHPELRAELRHHIAIGEAVRADREAYVPPSDVEHALMASLGLAPATAGTVAAGGGAVGAAVLARTRLFRSFAPMIGTFVLGLLVATGGFFAGYTGDQASMVTARDTIVIREIAAAPSPAPAAVETAPSIVAGRAATPAPRPSVARVDRAPRRSDAAMAVRETPVVIDRAEDVVETPAPVATTDEIEPTALRVADRTALPPIALATDDASTATAVRGLDPTAETFESIMETRDQGMAFAEYRAVSFMTPFVDNESRKGESGPTEEWTFGAFGRMGESFSVGVEAGQARYPQILVYPETYTSNGIAVGRDISRIDQDPNVLWVGLSGRQESAVLSERIPLWAQLTLGYGFDQGPIVNTRAGVSLELARRFSINTALETTSLVYFFNGQPLVSAKYGVSLGAQVGF